MCCEISQNVLGMYSLCIVESVCLSAIHPRGRGIDMMMCGIMPTELFVEISPP